ncbi:hypothetical protein BUALT_Bualt12G0070600 [Buddleja alternifolia]|uniref:Uncharacterized protein n=1 Tax=Buddleja alternifolia TaxID=168488 RepID=A0AAV6WWK5_9LAMI|nr:hypothetical protein BUALT_Bualt12G0070600 [Buddleja alternifolia]
MNTSSCYMVLTTLLLVLFSCHVVESNHTYDKLNATIGVQEVVAWRNQCPEANIQISQAVQSPTIGIPTYIVSIANLCNNNCVVAKVHVHCGWFSSARLVNPKLFKRLSFDDCVVNNGDPIPYGHIIEFEYETTFRYPLSVASYVCSA